MNFIDCIMNNAVLSKGQKERVVREYESMLADHIKKFGPVDGLVIAAQRYAEKEVERLTLKKLNVARHVAIEADRGVKVRSVEASAYKERKKKAGKLGSVFFYKSPVAGAIMRNYEKIGSYIGAEFEQNLLSIAKIANDYSSKVFGFTQDVKGFKDIVSEIQGVKTGNADAAKAATQLSRLFKAIHSEYKAVGGVMGEIKNYFPQRDLVENMQRLLDSHKGDRNAAFTEYLADKMLYVDRKAMINDKTGFAYNDEEFAVVAREIFDEMLNHGIYDAKLATHRVLGSEGGAIATRKSSSRFFYYKDAESFFANNNKYGSGDSGLFDNMIDYVQTMSRDIAVMRHLGPNADLVALSDVAAAAADGASVQMQRTIQGVYDTLSGRNAFGGAVGGVTKALENTQNFLRMVQLGSAPVAAIADSYFVGLTAKYNGLDATKAIQSYFAALNPLDSTDREIAKITAYVSSAVNANSFAHARFSDVSGTGIMRFGANAVNRMSGLAIMTDAARSVPAMQTMGFFHIAQHSKAKFNDLPREMKEALGRWDIDEVGYSHIMQAKSFQADEAGASFIRPQDVAEIDVKTARNYAAWLYDMSQTASNEPRMLTRAITTGAVLGEAKRGSVLRGVSSSLMMYKSYGITMMLNHTLPALQRAATDGKWGRAAAILGTMPLLAAATMQARNVLYGKSPEDMTKPDFWRRAAQGSGAFGPLTDLALGESTFDRHVFEQMLGPVYGFGKDAYDITKENISEALSGEKVNAPREAARLFQLYTPKLWYTRVLQERLLYDQLNRMADPMYDSRLRRIENKMREEKGQEFWWKP